MLFFVLTLLWSCSAAHQETPLTTTGLYETEITTGIPQNHTASTGSSLNRSREDAANQSSLEAPDSTQPEVSTESKDTNVMETEDELTKLDKILNMFLREELKRLSEVMRTGDPRLNIPSMDPLKLEDQIVKPMVSGESFDVHLRNIWITPLSAFHIKELESEIRESRIRLALYYPRLTANCEIETNGTLFDIFTITGVGNATVEFREVHARTMVYLTRDGNKLKVSMADQPFVDFSTSSVKFHGRQREGRKILSTTVASQFGPLFFWMFSTNIVEIIDYYLATYVNDVLSRFDAPLIFNSLSIPIRYLRVHVPQHPIPYGYVSPVYFHPKNI